MKKLVVLLVGLTLFLASVSCEKDILCDDQCGLVVSDRVDDYSVVIRNSCSGNERRFTLSPGDWMNAFVGSDYCITNSNGW